MEIEPARRWRGDGEAAGRRRGGRGGDGEATRSSDGEAQGGGAARATALRRSGSRGEEAARPSRWGGLGTRKTRGSGQVPPSCVLPNDGVTSPMTSSPRGLPASGIRRDFLLI